MLLLLLLLLLLLWCCSRATNSHNHIFFCTVSFLLVRILYVKENHFHWDFRLDWKKSTVIHLFSIIVERWSLKDVNEYKTMICTFFYFRSKNNNDVDADNLRLKKAVNSKKPSKKHENRNRTCFILKKAEVKWI